MNAGFLNHQQYHGRHLDTQTQTWSGCAPRVSPFCRGNTGPWSRCHPCGRMWRWSNAARWRVTWKMVKFLETSPWNAPVRGLRATFKVQVLSFKEGFEISSDHHPNPPPPREKERKNVMIWRYITSRWWFQTCFLFIPIWGKIPILTI